MMCKRSREAGLTRSKAGFPPVLTSYSEENMKRKKKGDKMLSRSGALLEA